MKSDEFKYLKTNHSITLIRIVFCLAILSFSLLYGQEREYRFKQISVENGLVSNETFAVQRDTLDFLWVGTIKGLARYDGKTVKHYQTIPGDSSSLLNSSAHAATLMLKEGSGVHFCGVDFHCIIQLQTLSATSLMPK